MKIATWNINSIRARADRALGVLERHDLDVLALQEIKCKPEQFPVELFEERGYEVAAHGHNQWNGVAIVSRIGLDAVRTVFDGQPGFTKGEPANGELFIGGEPEARAIGARVDASKLGEIEIWSLYVPNGRAIDDPHYHYKLAWLGALKDYAARRLAEDPQAKIALVGDWNVIPTDADVWDVTGTGGLYLTEAERAAFFAFEEAGFVEVSREYATNYTFWDYQRLRFPKNEGMRIDFVYASPALASHVTGAEIDRDERKGKGASDHVPVIVTLS
ncbi:exodeoxyribonuclease III [Trueperella bialowiezensis]|uniref:Exodeoxyribonuclease III n=1 Tax=Trueperella bialowiezensis TaxID=312285 RepID=A0A3S4V781_9ACTO|nr:exodeoxyribonuclease III [Trueperella bialowiezensis]VEI13566.1 Exodeoxyribonuclease III [Trueperella bialowiezensis]